MRIEFHPDRTILLFLDHEELTKRGFISGDDTANIKMINELVDDVILFAASSATDFPFESPIKTEASYVPHEGAYIRIEAMADSDDDLSPVDQLNVDLDRDESSPSMLFSFADFEYLISCAHKMPERLRANGTVFHYGNKYYLLVDGTDLAQSEASLVSSIIYDYAEKANIAIPLLKEYGNVIFASAALQEISKRFSA